MKKSTIPFYNVTSADDLLAASMGPRRFTMLLVASFASIALALACVGLVGVMAYLVSQRERSRFASRLVRARPMSSAR